MVVLFQKSIGVTCYIWLAECDRLGSAAVGTMDKGDCKVDSAGDKAAMRLVCKTLDLAASLTVSQYPAPLGHHKPLPHKYSGENLGSA